jgi:hypothetical protein
MEEITNGKSSLKILWLRLENAHLETKRCTEGESSESEGRLSPLFSPPLDPVDQEEDNAGLSQHIAD